MKSYSMDLRERVLQDCDGGMETRPRLFGTAFALA
jgi:hypothetical protein